MRTSHQKDGWLCAPSSDRRRVGGGGGGRCPPIMEGRVPPPLPAGCVSEGRGSGEGRGCERSTRAPLVPQAINHAWRAGAPLGAASNARAAACSAK